jgi:hypothetical protein
MGEYKEADPLAAKLAQCRPFLREDFESIDPRLPGLLKILQARGAGECWHKHGTFYEHLVHVYQILKLWGASDAVALFGLFHSSYSNSYVNLAIFAPDVDRSVLRDLIGAEAEELVHMFCIIPRHELIFDRLLLKLTDEDLAAGLQQYQGTAKGASEANGKGAHDKRRLFVPKEGIVVKHIRTGEDVVLPRRLVALFVFLTMGDFVDQLYAWQVQITLKPPTVLIIASFARPSCVFNCLLEGMCTLQEWCVGCSCSWGAMWCRGLWIRVSCSGFF